MTGFAWVAESAPLPSFVVRATVVLAAGIALAWLIRKRSAEVRHRLWTATLLLLLLLPGLALWAPRWEMPLLPVPARPAAETEGMGLRGTPPAELAAAPAPGAAAAAPPRSRITLTTPESSDLVARTRAAAPAHDVVAPPRARTQHRMRDRPRSRTRRQVGHETRAIRARPPERP